MRYILLLILAVSVGFGNELTINKNIVLYTKIKPIYLFANINVNSSSSLRNIGELSNENRKSIITSLNRVIDEAKKNDICKGGSYSINPIVNYTNNNRKTIGQDVNFSLTCKFIESEDLDNYNALLSNINKIISANKLLAFPQPSLYHRITNEEINLAKEGLFNKVLSDISNIEDSHSRLTNKKCIINSISASDSYQQPQARMISNNSMANSLKEESAATQAPIANEEDIQIDVALVLVCK